MTSRPPDDDSTAPDPPGEELARRIPRLALPPARAEEVRGAIRRRLAARARSRARWRLAAAAGLATVAMAVWYALGTPRVRLRPAEGPGGEFESLAVEMHRELRADEAALDLPTASPREVRRWLRRTGLSADLADVRRPDEEARFRLLGATRASAGFPVSAVSYRIDDRPVTLLVTTDPHAPEAPRWSLGGKTVRTFDDPGTGAHVLTWRNAGKAYSLVSELPGGGLEACFICHTDEPRRRLVERLSSGH